jgi:hypothetical protein
VAAVPQVQRMTRKRLSPVRHTELEMHYQWGGFFAGLGAFFFGSLLMGYSLYGAGFLWWVGEIACGLVGLMIGGAMFDSRFFTDD